MSRTGSPGLSSGLTAPLPGQSRLARAAAGTAQGPALGIVVES
jgi:hypothetical protein